jgi:Mn-dependent DtxR family transcriptional regulator
MGLQGDSLRREKTSVSQEDYLKAIWEMLQEDQTPISARLAEELNVTPPAVTAALKRMTRDGHVRVDRTGRIDRPEKGGSTRNAWRCGTSWRRCC